MTRQAETTSGGDVRQGSDFVRTVGALLGGQVFRMAIQGAYFLILARALGVSGFGAYSAVIALSAMTAPFSSLGTSVLMARAVSRDSTQAASQFGRACIYTVACGLGLSAALAGLSCAIAPTGVSSYVVLLLAIADLVGLKLVELVGILWQALGKVRPLAVLPSLANILRLVAACLMVTISGSDVATWAWMYLLSSVPFAAVVVFTTSRRLGHKPPTFRMTRTEIRDGLVFSVGLSSQTLYNDIDKVMLARIGSNYSAGIYSAAFRVLDMVYSPIRAIASATYPLYFKEGRLGLRGSLVVTRKVYKVVILYGALAAVAIQFSAPILPFMLGPGYEEAVPALKMLAPLVLLRGITYLAADALTGADLQGFRTGVQVAMMLANIALNIYLLPRYGLNGAIYSTLLCELTLAFLLWSRVILGIVCKTRVPEKWGPDAVR